MGLFDVIGSILSGKPAEFKNNNEQKTQPVDVNNAPESFGTPRDTQGLKVLPKVAIDRIECRVEEHDMRCTGVIRNYSEHRIELTKLILLGVDKPLADAGIDNFLEQGEWREFLLYSGEVASSDAQHDCELHYKNDSGDYFNAQHFVNFTVQPDNTYVFDTIEFVPPVRDIYE